MLWLALGTVGLVAAATAPAAGSFPVTAQAAASCQESVERRTAFAPVKRLQQWLASLTAAVETAATPASPVRENLDPEQLWIYIDRYSQTLTLFDGQREVVSYPVAVGKEETPTPPGEWRVVHKDKGWGGGFGTRWMGLNVPWGIYGIHGTNKPWSIGTYASAGCVRMFNANVEELFELVPLGTPVIISGDLPAVSERPEIAINTSGKFVLVFQVRLRQAGFDFGAIDGRFGPGVEAAVKNFQALYGLPVTGAVNRDQQRILWYPR